MMNKPKLHVEKPAFSKVFDIITVALLGAALVYLVLQWNQLPGKIPAHFGASGEIDRWGSKFELLILPVVAVIMWAGMTVLEKYPHVFNYMNLREDNIEIQYRWGILFMNATKNLSTLLLVFLIWQTNKIALGHAETLNMPVFTGLLAALFGMMLVYFYKVLKL